MISNRRAPGSSESNIRIKKNIIYNSNCWRVHLTDQLTWCFSYSPCKLVVRKGLLGLVSIQSHDNHSEIGDCLRSSAFYAWFIEKTILWSLSPSGIVARKRQESLTQVQLSQLLWLSWSRKIFYGNTHRRGLVIFPCVLLLNYDHVDLISQLDLMVVVVVAKFCRSL